MNIKRAISSTVLLLTVSLTYVVDGRIRPGPCPTPERQLDIDMSRLLGRWYEVQRDITTMYEWFMKCVTSDYYVREDGLIGIKNCFNLGFFQDCMIGRARCDDEDTAEGGCYVTFKEEDRDNMTKPVNYEILTTDYTSYAVVYNCHKINYTHPWAQIAPQIFHHEHIWIMSREPDGMNETVYEEMRDVIFDRVPGYPDFQGYKTKQGEDKCNYPGENKLINGLF